MAGIFRALLKLAILTEKILFLIIFLCFPTKNIKIKLYIKKYTQKKTMTLRDEIIADFKDLDSRVIKFLDRIISELEANNTVNEYSKSLLGMLVLQLMIYYKASDEVSSTNKLVHEDDYHHASKAPALQVLQKAHDQILVILDKLAVSPYSSAKVKKLQRTDDGEKARELLADLIG